MYSLILAMVDVKFVTHYPKVHVRVNMFASAALDILITIFALGTFLYFYRKLHNGNTNDQEREKSKENHKVSIVILNEKKAKFLVPFLMIAAYLVFDVTGTLTAFSAFRGFICTRKEILLKVGGLLVIVGYLIDACIYTFLHKGALRYITSIPRKDNSVGNIRNDSKLENS